MLVFEKLCAIAMYTFLIMLHHALLRSLPVQPGVALGLGLPAGAWCLAQLVLEDLAFFGDGCIFLDMVSAHSLS